MNRKTCYVKSILDQKINWSIVDPVFSFFFFFITRAKGMDKERGKFLFVFTSAELDVENKHGRTGISLSDPLEDRTKGWSTFSICNRLALSRLISEIYESMEIYASYGGRISIPFQLSSQARKGFKRIYAFPRPTTPYFDVYFTDFVVSFSPSHVLTSTHPFSLENFRPDRVSN